MYSALSGSCTSFAWRVASVARPGGLGLNQPVAVQQSLKRRCHEDYQYGRAYQAPPAGRKGGSFGEANGPLRNGSSPHSFREVNHLMSPRLSSCDEREAHDRPGHLPPGSSFRTAPVEAAQYQYIEITRSGSFHGAAEESGFARRFAELGRLPLTAPLLARIVEALQDV